jgi:hypothetical protein
MPFAFGHLPLAISAALRFPFVTVSASPPVVALAIFGAIVHDL